VARVRIDLIHFGVLVSEPVYRLLTPPVGSCIFIASSLAKISIRSSKPLWPF
jgi:TRAP-type C4-dicarboxylate transport system permease large subunit